MIQKDLPRDVKIQKLNSHNDSRGNLIEFYRKSWLPTESAQAIQWNVVESKAKVLRGVHVHRKHCDYLTLIMGSMLVGMRDLRKNSPTEGLATITQLTADEPTAIFIPTGVAHGFYFPEDSVHIYGLSYYFNPADELGCCWCDPELEIPWPCKDVIVSERDKSAPTFHKFMTNIEPFEYNELESEHV